MTAAALLGQLRARGVELRANGDTLLYRPVSAVGREDLEALQQVKLEMLRLLHAEDILCGPPPDPGTAYDILGPAPAPADLEALHYELAGALWDLRERQAGRQPWGGTLLVRGRPLADWLPLEEIARILRGGPTGR